MHSTAMMSRTVQAPDARAQLINNDVLSVGLSCTLYIYIPTHFSQLLSVPYEDKIIFKVHNMPVLIVTSVRKIFPLVTFTS